MKMAMVMAIVLVMVGTIVMQTVMQTVGVEVVMKHTTTPTTSVKFAVGVIARHGCQDQNAPPVGVSMRIESVDIAPQKAPPIAPSKAPPPKAPPPKAPPPKAPPSQVFGAIDQNSDESPNEHQIESAVGDQNAVQIGIESAASLDSLAIARLFESVKKFWASESSGAESSNGTSTKVVVVSNSAAEDPIKNRSAMLEKTHSQHLLSLARSRPLAAFKIELRRRVARAKRGGPWAPLQDRTQDVRLGRTCIVCCLKSVQVKKMLGLQMGLLL